MIDMILFIHHSTHSHLFSFSPSHALIFLSSLSFSPTKIAPSKNDRRQLLTRISRKFVKLLQSADGKVRESRTPSFMIALDNS